MQVDPIIDGAGSQSLNPYSYIGNNPLSGTDPTGYEKECDEGGANCTLTEVKSITVYQPHDGGKAFAVATDNQGNQIKAEAITNGTSTGVNGTLLTQGTLNGIINHDASAINSMAALGFGGQSVATGSGFDKNAYDIHERNSHLSEIGLGFGREMLKTGAAIGACYVRGLACVAIGLGKLSNGDGSGVGWVAGGAGGAYSEMAAVDRTALSAEQLRGPSTADELGPVRPGDTGTYGDLKAQKAAYGETEPLDMDHQPSFAAQVRAAETTLRRKLTTQELAKLKANTPAVASPRKIHQQTSPTYGGRNTPAQIAADALDLQGAGASNRAVFDEAMRNRQQ